MNRTFPITAALLVAGIVATSAQAGIILNETFDSPDVTGFTNTVATGWVGSGAGLVDIDTVTQLSGTGQAHWINTSLTTGSVLSAVLAANTTYTLEIDVARRTDLGGTLVANLRAGATVLDTVSLTPTTSDFSESVQIVFTPDGSHAGLIGQALSVQLLTSPHQPVVDNVVLDATLIPEPASLALLGLGGLALMRRRG